MKKFLTLMLATTLFLSSKAQIKVVKGADGKYHSSKTRKSQNVQATGTLYVDQDSVIHTIFKTDTNKYYIVRKSKKTGKEYKQYLKLD